MRPYEVMVVFDVERDEADVAEQLGQVVNLIRTRGGTPGQVAHMGRRGLAYEVKHRQEGYYVVIEAVADPSTMAEVDRLFALDDSVLRHKVIRQHEGVSGRAGKGSPQPQVAGGPMEGGRRDGAPQDVPAAPAGVSDAALDEPALEQQEPRLSEPKEAPAMNEPSPEPRAD